MAYQKKTENKEIEKKENSNLLEKELKEKDTKIEELNNKLESLQKQIELLLQGNTIQKIKDDYEEVEIGCRMFMKTPLVAQGGAKTFAVDGFGTRFIGVEDLRLYLKDSNPLNTRLFEKDVFYFTDPENYKRFKIQKSKDLSTKNILRIIKLPDTNDMIREVAELTNNKLDFTVLHSFQYQVVKILLTSNDLKNWDYDNRSTLERYLGQRFDDLKRSVNAYDFFLR